MLTGLRDLLHYTWAMAIVGDIMKIRANDIGLGDIAIVEMPNGEQSLAQVIQLEGDDVSLQVFGGGKGLSTQTTVRFFGHPTQVIYSPNILGRVFRGDGTPIDGGPDLSGDRQVDIGGPSVNPVTRVVPMKMIRTNVPMIDVFNCLVDRQLCEVPVGFKWFVPGLFDGSCCFGSEESAGASFLRHDGSVWTTDKDGPIMNLLAAEITAHTDKDPGEHYRDLTAQFGAPYYTRLDAPATLEQKARLEQLSPDAVTRHQPWLASPSPPS
jgi:hypothetical protein